MKIASPTIAAVAIIISAAAPCNCRLLVAAVAATIQTAALLLGRKFESRYPN